MSGFTSRGTTIEVVRGEVWELCDDCVTYVADSRRASHLAGHRRQALVEEAALESNRRGSDFQPGQVWSTKRRNRRRTGVVREGKQNG